MRLAQGNGDAASAAVGRALSEATQPLKRAALLPAYVQIKLAVGDAEKAHSACRELMEIAERQQSDALGAMSAQACGAVALAEADARTALVELRRAWHAWQALPAPYEAARVRELIGLACRQVGDEDAATMKLDAARAVFAQLGAAPDLRRLDLLTARAEVAAHGLTSRELEVLRLVASGRTNKAIAAELVLSERTVDRHVSNIFTKLRVSTRAAATAYAYEHQLV